MAIVRKYLLLIFLGTHLHFGLASPAIVLTNIPSFGPFEDLSGLVVDAAPAAHRVAVFIYAPGAGWWSKPYCDPQLTVIRPDGSWTADITTGGVDEFATKITALLVSTNYSEPCVMGLSALPSNVLAQAVASATVERLDPKVRRISFSGYDWWIKTSSGLVGPGPNYFSDSTDNVWLDAQGRLHLRITNRSNQWQCAEIVTQRTFGYGSYRFELDSPVNNLNPNAVLGLFTWSDDPAYAHREIDIECSRWGNTNDVNNAQYVVQPWDLAGHLTRYAVPAGLTNSTHLFTWETNRVSYRSQRGSYSPVPAATNIISTWTFNDSAATPQTGDENIRINLWLFNGIAPTDNQEVEFIIKSFEFVPLGPARAALLDQPRWQDGQFVFDLSSQPDRRYQVQISTNLSYWQNLGSLLATNNVVSFADTNKPPAGLSFYEVITLP
ncbi:MAG: glycoside hydrolase family 16 protein [Verrucomicrobia bacterium]|nr:glycoside hydrolase family 16 protein [Verrucomicrobiota bacterium]